MESEKKSNNNSSSLQDIQASLSIGYVFLILMGLLNETLYYNQLGIEILTYSSILDVLISPISKLTSSGLKFGIFIFLLISVLILPSLLAEKHEKQWIRKAFNIKPNQSKKETKSSLFRLFVSMFAIGLLGFYVGTGSGGGARLLDKIENGEIVYGDTLVFLDGESERVEIVGKNSSYVFYLTKENDAVKVTPIGGIIRSIEEK